ncbi:MAG: hypothetical protein NC253_02220 [Ruminococcus sp.]|nr:hypothetical protein [Ruminococcus sp.]MCM1479623.1 hypothetical protein [Muribaculaceae bacterium]
MRKIRFLLCTLFAAAVMAGMSAVSAFAEIYVKTEKLSGETDKAAQEVWKDNKFMMQYGMDDREKANAVKLEQGFLVKGIDGSKDDYIYPVTSGGEVLAMVSLSKKESGGFSRGFFNFDFGFNSLKTTAGSPADIYSVDGTYIAVIGGEYFVMEENRSSRNKSSAAQIKTAFGKVEKYREENPSNGKYITACGFSKNGWRTVNGKKYFIKSSGMLARGWQTIGDVKYYFDQNSAAVTKDTTIGGKRYRFDSDGKYLGTFTGFVKSGGKRYYYKDGVKQTGDFKVGGKTYRADKNGVISE